MPTRATNAMVDIRLDNSAVGRDMIFRAARPAGTKCEPGSRSRFGAAQHSTVQVK